MEFENLLTLIKTVSGSELTSFTMKDGDLKISMGKEKQVVVEQTGMQVMPAVGSTCPYLCEPKNIGSIFTGTIHW